MDVVNVLCVGGWGGAAETDMRLYSSYDPTEREVGRTIYDVEKEVAEDFTIIKPLPEVSKYR